MHIKGAGTPFSLVCVQFVSQKITSIVLSPHNHGYANSGLDMMHYPNFINLYNYLFIFYVSFT